MFSHPETPSGEDLNQVADYYRRQAHQHAAQGDQASADICYQVADMANNLRHWMTVPPPARHQPEDQC